MKTALRPIQPRSALALVSAAAVVLLTACGGGGGDDGFRPPPPVDALPGGLWEGTVTIDETLVPVGLMGVSTDAGEIRLFDDEGRFYFANTNTSGDSFTGGARVFAAPGTAFADDSLVTTGRVDGTIVERGRLTGTFTLDSGDSMEFDVDYNDLYERNSSLALIGGMWVDLSETVFNVDADGIIFAQDSLGCVYDGVVSVIDPDFDAYDIAISVSQCADFDGAYQGLGVLDDLAFEGDNDAFVVLMSNDTLALLLALERM